MFQKILEYYRKFVATKKKREKFTVKVELLGWPTTYVDFSFRSPTF
jgi:hypothetical protein